MSDQPFSIAVPVAQIRSEGKRFRIEVDEADRRSIAEALAIVDVADLRADIEVRPVGDRAFAVRGSLAAAVVQTDVVTLEPVRQNVAEEIDLTLVPEAPSTRKPRAAPLDTGELDERDVYRNGRIDLGAVIFEHLALGLDPYPKSSGVEFKGHVEDHPEAESSAFAALASLKRAPE